MRHCLIRPHHAGAMVSAHLFHSEPLDLVDDRIELRLPTIEDAQMQAAITAVEAGCGKAVLGKPSRFMIPGWPQPVTVTIPLSATLTKRTFSPLTCNNIEHSKRHARQQAVDAAAVFALRLGENEIAFMGDAVPANGNGPAVVILDLYIPFFL